MLTKLLASIDAAQHAIDAAVAPIVKERMNAYREQFGSLSRVDCHMWDSVCISFVMEFQSMMLGVTEDD